MPNKTKPHKYLFPCFILTLSYYKSRLCINFTHIQINDIHMNKYTHPYSCLGTDWGESLFSHLASNIFDGSVANELYLSNTLGTVKVKDKAGFFNNFRNKLLVNKILQFFGERFLVIKWCQISKHDSDVTLHEQPWYLVCLHLSSGFAADVLLCSCFGIPFLKVLCVLIWWICPSCLAVFYNLFKQRALGVTWLCGNILWQEVWEKDCSYQDVLFNRLYVLESLLNCYNKNST